MRVCDDLSSRLGPMAAAEDQPEEFRFSGLDQNRQCKLCSWKTSLEFSVEPYHVTNITARICEHPLPAAHDSLLDGCMISEANQPL